MNSNFEELLHPRITKHCKELVEDRHFKHAALEAMTQVELAMKEKSGEEHKFGVNLVRNLFGQGKSVKLKMPFGEKMQKQTEDYFIGAFGFYRNYAAHDGSRFDENTCRRCLIVASELLDLIGASEKSFADIGGIGGLLELGLFQNEEDLCEVLVFLQEQPPFPVIIPEGFYEGLADMGYGESHLISLIDLGIVQFKTNTIVLPDEVARITGDTTEEVGWFELTSLGASTLKSLVAKI